MSIKKSVVLFSGNGSNLKNLLENSSNIKNKLVYEGAFTNNPKAGGIEICQNFNLDVFVCSCLLYTSPSPRDKRQSRMPSSA